MIENILANKQRYIGTMEAGSEPRIMQWNLTGLNGATWAEELINVWGPGGIICAFVNVLSSHTKALIVLSVQQMFSSYQPVYTIMGRHRSPNGGYSHFSNTIHAHTDSQIYTAAAMPTFCLFEEGRCFPKILCWWYSWPALVTISSTTAWECYKERQSDWPSCPLLSNNFPPAVICCHGAKLLPQVIYSFSCWLLHHLCSCHADWFEIHRDNSRGTSLPNLVVLSIV